MGELIKSIGLMSGTSMDGIDVALIETDGESVVNVLDGAAFSYETADRDLLAEAVRQVGDLEDPWSRPAIVQEAEDLITERHLGAVRQFMEARSLTANDIGLIGFHGQTILHRPEIGLTLQVGDGAKMSEALGVKVVYDFRSDDVAAGGQGAPLVPVYHQALVGGQVEDLPTVVVNIGGVGNVTFIGADGVLVAFDTGPGNALIDDWVRLKDAGSFDAGGALALGGEVDEDVLAFLMENAYFSAPLPKSLDRNDFSLEPVRHLSLEDGAATLARFTACSLVQSQLFMPDVAKRWIVCGGGAKNKAILQALSVLLEGEVITADALGWDGDLIEAQAFAYLAVRSLKGLPLTFPGTTGVPKPQTGGRLADRSNSRAA